MPVQLFKKLIGIEQNRIQSASRSESRNVGTRRASRVCKNGNATIIDRSLKNTAIANKDLLNTSSKLIFNGERDSNKNYGKYEGWPYGWLS